MALLSGSPALDRGSNARANDAGLIRDQRGFERGFDADGDFTPTVDMGAYEFQIDEVSPAAVLVSAPNVAHPGGRVQTIVVEFTDAIGLDLSSFDDSDVRVTGPGGYDEFAGRISVVDSAGATRGLVTYEVPAAGGVWDQPDNGTYQVSLRPVQVADASGNFAPGGVLGTFAVMIEDVEPGPFQMVEPLGGLIREFSEDARIAVPGETDRFTVESSDGQTITVVVDPEATLQPTIELFDPGSTLLGSVTAGAAGEDAVLQAVPTTSAGTYTYNVAGAVGSSGAYTVQLILNAAVEAESHNGPANDDPPSAQDLDASFVVLSGGPAARGAVLGTLDSSGDWYQVTLGDGESASLVVATPTPGDLTLQWYNSSLDLLAMGLPATSVQQVIKNFVDATTNGDPDTYFVRVAGNPGMDYSLVITRRGDFDVEPLGGPAPNAQDITATGDVLGYLGLLNPDPLRQHAIVDPGAAVDPDSNFGYSVDVSGEVAIVGAHEAERAYIFRFDGSRWNLEQELGATDRSGTDKFGLAVSISGDRAIVGATYCDDVGGASGAAYVFQFDGNQWVFQQKLIAPDGNHGLELGYRVSLHGDTAMVGAKGDDYRPTPGGVHVFQFDGSQWVQQQKLVPSDATGSDLFGVSVAVSGDAIMVGAEEHDAAGSNSGAAYVFEHNGSQWIQRHKLLAAGPNSGDYFGSSVSLSGDLAVVGAKGHDGAASDAGAAYLFQYDGIQWLQRWQMTALRASPSDHFGHSVAIDGGEVIVGVDKPSDRTGAVDLLQFAVPYDGHYAFGVQTCDRLVISTATPNDGPGEPPNGCDPTVRGRQGHTICN